MIKLLHITDHHLFKSKDSGQLLGINTYHSFTESLRQIKDETQSDYHCVICSGDISQDFSTDSYHHFAQLVEPLNTTCYWIPGNHDNTKTIQEALNQYSHLKSQAHLVLSDEWQVIFLNSHLPYSPRGYLNEHELSQLDELLTTHHQRHTIITMHHHPIDVGCKWLDQHRLDNRSDFWAVLEKHSNVKIVLCGHVHQEQALERQGVQLLTTPSTCIQFKPNSEQFALDTLNPGWRTLTLYPDGRFDTEVKRCTYSTFTPDMNSQGY